MMLLSKLLENLDFCRMCGDVSCDVADIIYHSQNEVQGCVFICIKGFSYDSHEDIPQVIERQAAAIVIEDGFTVSESLLSLAKRQNVTLISVKNTRKALGEMSRAFFSYPERDLLMIGITGTKGKTTTAVLMKQVLEAAGIKTGMIGTMGVFIGEEQIAQDNTTPQSYLIQKYLRKMSDCGCRAAVMEVSSLGLKQERVQGIVFDYGILTNISSDHIAPAEHASLKEYIYWKGRLFDQCKIGIVNGSDSYVYRAVKNCHMPLETFGMSGSYIWCQGRHCTKHFDYEVSHPEYVCEHGVGMRFDAGILRKSCISTGIYLNLPGIYNIYNALVVMAVADHLNIGMDILRNVFEKISVCGRCECVGGLKGGQFIIDYAHNGNSLKSVLSALRKYRPKRLICVFGCGGNRSPLRRKDMARAAFFGADHIIITTDNPRFEDPLKIIDDIECELLKLEEQLPEKCGTGYYEVIVDRQEAISHCARHMQAGDFVLVAGKGHEDYQEICGVKYPFDEHEIIQKEIEKYG